MHAVRRPAERGMVASRRVAALATLTMFVVCAVTVSAEARRIDAAKGEASAPVPRLRCPVKIVPKCKPGEKPYCADFSGNCCRAISCQVKK
jgi:hypothetical protein